MRERLPEGMQRGLRLDELARGSWRRPRKRVGRGNGSGRGTTCGRGVKGQKSRSGGYHKVGFEGGQMPIQRRLPKIGFRSAKSRLNAEVRLGSLAALDTDTVDREVLVREKLAPRGAKRIKVILAGEIKRAVVLRGLAVTANARKAVEAAGGRVEE